MKPLPSQTPLPGAIEAPHLLTTEQNKGELIERDKREKKKKKRAGIDIGYAPGRS